MRGLRRMSNNTFCIFKHNINPYVESHILFPDIYANTEIPNYKSHFIIITGDIYNIKDLKKKFHIESDVAEEIILELYFKFGVKIPNYLKGIFAIAIINSEKIVLFRDYFSCASIYFYIDDLKSEFIISNKIVEIKRFMNLKVNTEILPRFFVRSSLSAEDTFFEKIKSLKFAEFLELSINENKLTSIPYDDSFYKEIRNDQLKDNIIINKSEDIILRNFKEILDYYSDCDVINSLSGGVDSSYLQILLKELGFSKAYTYSHEIIGIRTQEYSKDISKYLGIEHNIVELKSDCILDNIIKGILICEIPYIFEGELLQNYMYNQIRKKEGKEILITCGSGCDTVFAFQRAFFELKYLTNPLFLAIFNIANESLLKMFDRKKYNVYKTIIRKLRNNKLDEELLYILFDRKVNLEIIKKAFYLDNIFKIYSPDIEMINRFEIDFIEKIQRWRYDFEIQRENYVSNLLCKYYELKVCFPYVNKELLFFLFSVPIAKKIRRLTQKYYIKKLLSRYLPSKLVYRRKITTGTKSFLFFFNDEKISKIIKAIKNTKYQYFNFDYEAIFSDEKYYGLAIKIINFYIWHKIFIENMDIKDIL